MGFQKSGCVGTLFISTAVSLLRPTSFSARTGSIIRSMSSQNGGAIPTIPPIEYMDVHTHLFHRDFGDEQDILVDRAIKAGLKHIVVNGLEPKSNRIVLEMCSRYPNNILLPAVGIYPIDACVNAISLDPSSFEHRTPVPFDIDEEVSFIEEQASLKKVIAIGECGLDAYYVSQDQPAFTQQEEVFEKLIGVALKYNLPLIIHSRKAELRVFEMLKFHKVLKADFHCYSGKQNLAKQICEEGYHISIPSAVARNNNFKNLVQKLPLDKLLSETDAPYMGPVRGERNEPSTIPAGVKAIADARGEKLEDVAAALAKNFYDLFGRSMCQV